MVVQQCSKGVCNDHQGMLCLGQPVRGHTIRVYWRSGQGGEHGGMSGFSFSSPQLLLFSSHFLLSNTSVIFCLSATISPDLKLVITIISCTISPWFFLISCWLCILLWPIYPCLSNEISWNHRFYLQLFATSIWWSPQFLKQLWDWFCSVLSAPLVKFHSYMTMQIVMLMLCVAAHLHDMKKQSFFWV
jgi:hypothetical protein